MQSPYLSADPTTLPFSESQAMRLLDSWLALAGVDPSEFPLDRERAALVLTAGGYRADDAELERLGKLGFLPDVAGFDAKDVLACASALEARRAWEYPSVHSPKRHYTATILEQARAEGPDAVAALRAMKRADLTFLLKLMTECENRELREQLLTTIRLVLEVDHGVLV